MSSAVLRCEMDSHSCRFQLLEFVFVGLSCSAYMLTISPHRTCRMCSITPSTARFPVILCHATECISGVSLPCIVSKLGNLFDLGVVTSACAPVSPTEPEKSLRWSSARVEVRIILSSCMPAWGSIIRSWRSLPSPFIPLCREPDRNRRRGRTSPDLFTL